MVSVYRATLCHGTEPVVKTERKKIERSYRQHCHARNLTPTRRRIILPSKLVFFSLRSNVKRSPSTAYEARESSLRKPHTAEANSQA